MQATYTLRKTDTPPALTGAWDSPVWTQAPTLAIDWFHPKSTDHRPRTEARLLYDEEGLYVIFRVQDRYVRSTCQDYNGPVCRDSCVECFLQPHPENGHFNFEINAGGTLHASYVEDPTRLPDEQGFVKCTPLSRELGAQVRIFHSLPEQVEPERTGPTEWTIEYAVPFRLFEPFLGRVGPVNGQIWRGNLYKCGDQTSHPHWATWAPLGDTLDFHTPQHFAPLRFA